VKRKPNQNKVSDLQTYAFNMRVEGKNLDELSELASALRDVAEIYPAEVDGQQELTVYVSESSPRMALLTVKNAIESSAPELHIIRVDLDLVTVAEIAERAGVTAENARLWAGGKRRKNFPAAFCQAGNSKLWAWADVFAWLEAQGIGIAETYEEHPLPVDLVESFNGSCARYRATWASSVPTARARLAPISFNNPRSNKVISIFALGTTSKTAKATYHGTAAS
jgi:uncharacterized small protein (DUF1192 family)